MVRVTVRLPNRLASSGTPTSVCLYGLAIVLLTGYRITRASHQETLQQLAAEAEQAGVIEPAV